MNIKGLLSVYQDIMKNYETNIGNNRHVNSHILRIAVFNAVEHELPTVQRLKKNPNIYSYNL